MQPEQPARVSAWALYCRYIGVSFRAQMQYRMSFIMSTVAQFLVTFIEVAAIWALFDRFGNLPHWTLGEVCLFYGVVNVSFALSEAITPGFDFFGPYYIKTGQFDRLLLRPRSVVLQLFGHELALRRIGRLIQGLVVFGYGVSTVYLEWNIGNISLTLFAVAGGVAMFTALLVFQATLSVWTVESLEVMNTMTYGGVQTAQYPFDIYEDWFRKVFTYIVPLACVAYFPIVAVIGKADPLGSSVLFQILSPSFGFVFLAVSLLAFRFGVRKYTSTGS